ncbi:antirestriction protein [Xenorhabdus miraniensis]|uniref:Antirestriction protein n=1 Tax=Xenorhabdus miraniensis TaxID=351674 RepID=A0A2D0JL75_9GAMM|nr:antirestriction protein [Xenorhabdus miraniensis]PHM46899.1 antirestriction protein [Xenorhabdus miraniensis]
MQKSELIMLDSSALSAVFPGKKPLERLFLGFLIANTATRLCGEYRYECWDRRDVSEQLAYMVPTSAATYSVCLPDTITLSADAFGLAVTTAVFARIAVLDEPDEDAYRFGELREYALQHPETELIRAVLDLRAPYKVLSPSLICSVNNNHH